MTDKYQEDELRKLWTVIKAALLNGPSGDSVRIETVGADPHASVTIKAYLFEKFIKEHV